MLRSRLTLLVSTLFLTGALLGCSDESANPTTTGSGGTGSGGGSGGAAPPVELTPNLCDDPSLMTELLHALGERDETTYGMINPQQVERMIMNPTAGPFYMVNLMRFRAQAKYPDGRVTDLTGREANELYSPIEFLTAIGASVVFVGDVTDTTTASPDSWDQVAIVEYPCPLALFAMTAHPEFRERGIHKEAGLEASFVIVTHLQSVGDPPPAQMPFPPTADDPAFNVVNVFRLRDQAEYPAGSTEPNRTGQQAIDLYAESIAAAEAQVGITRAARLDVEGVYIGDGRDWDWVWIDNVPSQATYDAFSADTAAAQLHRDAALEEAYGLSVDSFIATIPTR